MAHKFRVGEVILLDGLYSCDSCELATAWGVPGRRFPKPECGHPEWKLIRRRVDVGF